MKDSVFKARFKLKEIDATHSDRRIFVNEDLTAYRAQIASAARRQKKERNLSDTWTASRNVMVIVIFVIVIFILQQRENIYKHN